MVEVRRNLWRTSGPTTVCSRRSTYSKLISNASRIIFTISEEKDYTTCLDNMYHCSVNLTVRKKKKSFLIFRGNSLCFRLGPFLLVLLLGFLLFTFSSQLVGKKYLLPVNKRVGQQQTKARPKPETPSVSSPRREPSSNKTLPQKANKCICEFTMVQWECRGECAQQCFH